ncbi:hypothetical protein [Nocardia gamkensis]|uniref:Uncharacterized protein n=1 Tax=Nocardia gamkensis TaxID=352869 RepID=A0A7X6L7T0_9NOCA|nr:hypothetical protein [Nocardia gamkensis]NKY29428.1 hypothetical protein [Nocardia gamkensis]NQE66969.1 hypothetical protein [Nocardia gamkensis]
MGFQLPHPEVLWARVTVLDVITAATRTDRVASGQEIGQTAGVEGGRLISDDGEGNWYSLVRYPGDRALLFGRDEDNEVAGTSYDPLAAAPAWVRSVEPTAKLPGGVDGPVSFVRWWEFGRWQHTPTDLDDGLEMGLSAASDRESFTGSVMSAAIHAKWVEMDYEAGKLTALTVDPTALHALCDATENGTVTKAHFYFLQPGLTAPAFTYLTNAGVLTSAAKPTEPLP